MFNKCSICGSIAEPLEYSFTNSVTSDNRFINKNISYSYCENCDYIFIDYDKRVDLKEFYQNDYDFLLDNDEVEPEIDGVKYSEYLVDFFSEYVKNDNTKSILDIGAGKGNLLESFYKKFHDLNYFAVEPSNAFLRLKEKDFIKEKYHCFFDKDVFRDKRFSYITLVEVLEHVPEPKSFLLSICEVMHADSLLLVEVPNFENHKSDLLTADHLSLFTEFNLTNLFKICGLEVIKKNITNRVPMQFIVKLGNNMNFDEKNKTMISLALYKEATKYVEKVIEDAISIKNETAAIYGQNVLLDYLIGNDYLSLSNIECIINDNKLYQGKKKWKGKIDIVGFEEFHKNCQSNNILLAMNDCYHDRVTRKLVNKNIYGTLSDRF